MSEKKRAKHKAAIIALVAIILLFCCTVGANAATEGALFEGVKMLVNGEEVDVVMDHIRHYKDADGNDVVEYYGSTEDGEYSIEAEQAAGVTVAKDGSAISVIIEDTGD